MSAPATPAAFGQLVVFTNTSDLEESRAFYGGVLELPLVLEQAGFVLIFQSSRDSFLGVCLRGSREAGDTTGAIPTLVCDTPAAVDRWQAKLQAKGVAIEKRAGSGVSSDGKLIPSIYNLFIRDPAGYLVEIQAFLDPAWPSPPPPFAPASDGAALVAMSATEAVSQLRLGAVTPSQLIDAFVEQHAKVEAAVNAVPILCVERARAAAAALAEAGHPSPPPPGYLFGLPVVIKDLSAVEGAAARRFSPPGIRKIPLSQVLPRAASKCRRLWYRGPLRAGL